MLDKLKQDVERKIQELQKYSKKEWGVDVQVSISYELRSARTLGQFVPLSRTIILNEKLLEEYGEVYILDTVVHEFAHAVIFYLYPTGLVGRKKVRSHGKEFKAVCSHFGNDGYATSSLFKNSKTITNAKGRHKRWTYKCGCQNHEIPTTTHNRIMKGTRSYTCYKCNEILRRVY